MVVSSAQHRKVVPEWTFGAPLPCLRTINYLKMRSLECKTRGILKIHILWYLGIWFEAVGWHMLGWNLLSILCVTSSIRFLHCFFKTHRSGIPAIKILGEGKELTWYIWVHSDTEFPSPNYCGVNLSSISFWNSATLLIKNSPFTAIIHGSKSEPSFVDWWQDIPLEESIPAKKIAYEFHSRII